VVGRDVSSVSTIGHLWRSVGVLSGTAVGRAIPLLGAVVIARIYAPGEYGLYAACLGIAPLAAVNSFLRAVLT
jgi:O-antigen/teichoic acid export membrane protein